MKRVTSTFIVVLLSAAALGALSVAVMAAILPGARPRAADERQWSPLAPVVPLVMPSLQSAPNLALAGDTTLLAFTDSRNSAPDVYVNVSSGGTRSADRRVTNPTAGILLRANDQAAGVIEASGAAYLAYADQQKVYLARQDAAAGTWYSRTLVSPSGDIPWNSSARAPHMAGNGAGNVLIVWEDFRNQTENLRTSDVYARSCNAAALTCAGEVKLNTDTGNVIQRRPRVAVNGTNAVVVWEDFRERSEAPRVYARFSGDGGATWSGDLRVNKDAGGGLNPADRNAAANPVAAYAADGSVYVAWEQSNGSATAPADIVVARWDGSAWGAPVRVDSAPARVRSVQPSIAASSAGVFVAWTDYRAGARNPDIYSAVLNGATWSESRVTSDGSAQTLPALAASGGTVRIAWQDSRSGAADVYTAAWSGGAWGGEALAHETPERSAPQLYPDIEAVGGTAYVAFADARDGDLAYRIARMNGAAAPSWELVTQLPEDNGDLASAEADIAAGGNALHAVYVKYQDGIGESIVYASYNGNSWSELALVSRGMPNTGKSDPAFDMSENGSTGAAAWITYGAGEQHTPYAAVFRNGAWETPVALSATPKQMWGRRMTLAVDSAGVAHLVWADSEGANGRGKLNYSKRNLTNGTAWETKVIVPAANSDWCGQDNPQLKIDGNGAMHLVWTGCTLKSPPNAWPHEIFAMYARSTDGGTTWSTPARIGKTEVGDDNETGTRPAIGVGVGNEVFVLYPAKTGSSYEFYRAQIVNGTPGPPVQQSGGRANWLRAGTYFGQYHGGDGRGAVGFDPQRLRLVVMFPDRSNGRSAQLMSAVYGELNVKSIFVPVVRR
jgi:hypothetical protein